MPDIASNPVGRVMILALLIYYGAYYAGVLGRSRLGPEKAGD